MKTIVVNQVQRDRAQIEKVPAAAFYPGHLLELTTSDTVQKHSSQNGIVTPPMFAIEDNIQGNTIDTAYATTGRAQVWIPQRGDEVYAVLADGQNVSIGSKLASNGDGTLKIHTANIIAVATEALDLSDSSGGESSGTLGYDKRVKVRIV